MAGNIPLKELSSTGVTITSTGGSATNGSAISAGTIDFRAAGTASLIEAISIFFELLCQWTTVTGIAAGTVAADLFLIPAIDGTNFVDVDTTSGSSYIPATYRVGSFVASKAPVSNTNMRFAVAQFDIFPTIYTCYVLNRSGQTISANWTLKCMGSEGQYT